MGFLQPTIPLYVFPGPAVPGFLATGRGVVPPVLPNRADRDADATGGDAAPGEFGTVCGAGSLICEPFWVVPPVERARRTGLDTLHAPGAEVVFPQGVGREVCGGEDRTEPDPGTVFGCYEGVVHAEGSESGKECGVPVREEGDGVLQEDLDAPIAIPGDKDRGITLFVEERREPVGVLVEQGVDGLVQLVVVDRGGGLKHREVDREADDDHRPGLRKDRLRVELLRHPGFKRRVLPPVRARDPDKRDLHPPAPAKDGCLEVVVHDNGSFLCAAGKNVWLPENRERGTRSLYRISRRMNREYARAKKTAGKATSAKTFLTIPDTGSIESAPLPETRSRRSSVAS